MSGQEHPAWEFELESHRVLSVLVAVVLTAWMTAFVPAAIALDSLQPWFEEGHVNVLRSAEDVRLTGAPGDDIKLRFPVPAVADANYSEFVARLGDPEAGSELLGPLRVRTQDIDDDDEPDRVYGKLVVPDRSQASDGLLTGTLSGSVVAQGRVIDRWEVPLSLQVTLRGTGVTSGTRNMTWPRMVAAALYVELLGPLLLVPLIGLLGQLSGGSVPPTNHRDERNGREEHVNEGV